MILLCKRFKQRNERHLIKTFGCRLKHLATATLILRVSKLWGKLNPGLSRSCSAKAATALGYAIGCLQRSDVMMSRCGSKSVGSSFFFPCQLKPVIKQLVNPPARNPPNTRPPTQQKSENMPVSLHTYTPPRSLGIPPVELPGMCNYLLVGRQIKRKHYITNIMGAPLPPQSGFDTKLGCPLSVTGNHY